MIKRKVQFKLINNNSGETLKLSWEDDNDANKPAPDNWESIERKLMRNTKTYGVYTELSRDVEFTKDGADFLERAYFIDGIEANVTLEEYRQYPNQEGYYLNSTGLFDFSEYTRTENKVKVPFKTGGLNSLLKSQLSEKFQLERLEAINGAELSPLEKIIVALTSRRILLISELKTEEDRQKHLGHGNVSAAVVPNLEVISNSDQENIQSVFTDNEFYWSLNGSSSETEADTYQLFYFNSNVSKTLKVRVRFRIRANKGGMDTTNYQARIYRYNFDGNNLNYQDNDTLINTGHISPAQWVEYDQEIDIDLNAGDCLRLGFLLQAGNGTVTSSAFTLYIDYIEVKIVEDSIRVDSNCEALFIHEVGDRLMQILTGEQEKYYSEFYGREDIGYTQDGEYSRTALALGLWIRKFEDKPMEISIKEFIETCFAIHNTGYTIDIHNGVEKFIHEDMRYFFQEFTGITINEQVSNVKRSAATELHWSNGWFGFKKGGEYEEAMGLDEYNTQGGWTFPITRVDNKYGEIAPARADSYGKEFARRKPKLNYPEEDTRYDKDIFILDLKLGEGEAYVERTWEDDYEEAPTGVYSPETATGLRLTPFRIMKRHEWFFKCALYRYEDEYIRFSNSGIRNTDLTTKIVGEDAKREDTNKLISELDSHLFVGEWVEFDYPVDYDLYQQVVGKSINNDGRLVPNYFGKVKFINENYQVEYGYLFEFSQNNEGKWKVLKANF